MRLSLLLLLVLGGCGSRLAQDQTVCEEYRDLKCLTGEVCSFDNKRGCQVCQCDEPYPHAPDDPRVPPPDPSGPQ